MTERDELVARLQNETRYVELSRAAADAADQIDRDKREIDRLRLALRIIAGYEQCLDNLMSNTDVARAALNKETNQ